MIRWTTMVSAALLIAGCAADDLDDGDEGAVSSPGDPETTEDVEEANQAVVLGSYSAQGTSHATKEEAVKKLSFTIGAGKTIMIGTDGISGASNSGDTVLRLFGPTGDQLKANDDYACSPDFGSRIAYKSPYDQPKTFTLWAGCAGEEACGPNTIAVARRRLLFDYSAKNTQNAKKNYTKDGDGFTAGQKLRISTCATVAPGATHKGDTFLRLYRKDGGAYLAVASNDESNLCQADCGLASSILYELPSDGYYEVRAGCAENTTCSGTVAVYVE